MNPSKSFDRSARLRRLPSVEALSAQLADVPRRAAVTAAREEIAHARHQLSVGRDYDLAGLSAAAAARARALASSSLRGVINATGVVIHTNLGRAPLPADAARAAAKIGGGYSNLEYDLPSGRRSRRHRHVEDLICRLTAAEAALAVNNNAAAVMLALTVASGREVIVSRGQLVEIGGSFRVPEIVELAGVRLVEVGTTNRTRIGDYAAAITDATAAILRVHQSNFRTVGFVEETPLRDLCELARSHDLVVIDDVGSGALEVVGDEPVASESATNGSDLVCFSADKLLGGPQAGIICGRSELITRCRSHPLARAIRLDKLQLAALEATLRLHHDHGPQATPVWQMLHASEPELRRRAERLSTLIGEAARVTKGTSRPGGGALPLMELSGPLCAVDPGPIGAGELAARLRRGDPAVVARIAGGEVVLDPRTMTDDDAVAAGAAVRRTLA